MKRLAILGSTGSIGKSCLAVAAHLGYPIVALAANENIDLIEAQAKEFSPLFIAVYNSQKAQELQKRLPKQTILSGMEGLLAVASCREADIVISAMSGTIGLQPTIAAIQAGKQIGLANKEVLVSGGSLIMRLIREKNVTMIPIDSEHSAIFQCLKGEENSAIERLVLTASGGPFRALSSEQMEHITVDQALKHPNYQMGAKITIDSSTLMNKGLEMIEAHWLFQVPVGKIEVVIHPQQIIHSLVEFQDGSMLAQMGEPTMLIPIQYAMTYPNRLPGMLKPFDFLKHSKLDFYLPNKQIFRCLALAEQALIQGDSFPCYLNAANEVLVEKFLKGEISWKEISIQLDYLMNQHTAVSLDSLETILAVDALAREEAARCEVTSC